MPKEKTSATATAPETAKKSKPRVAPEITKVSAAVEMPKTTSNRGSTSQYPFDDLEQGQSFGVLNKTKKDMASIVSNQNKKNKAKKLDENGNVVFTTKIVTGADGTKTEVPTDKPEMISEKFFFVVDTDPANDPDKASCRVFRKI